MVKSQGTMTWYLKIKRYLSKISQKVYWSHLSRLFITFWELFVETHLLKLYIESYKLRTVHQKFSKSLLELYIKIYILRSMDAVFHLFSFQISTKIITILDLFKNKLDIKCKGHAWPCYLSLSSLYIVNRLFGNRTGYHG